MSVLWHHSDLRQALLCRTRGREAELAESVRERERERQLVEETQLDPGRCEHLGYDRHWNRYWLFGAWDGPGEGEPHQLAGSLLARWVFSS